MNALSQQPRTFRRLAWTRYAFTNRAFTLVEILVVMVIILLMLGMAVPVLHVITGSQSEAGAGNMIAAMLGRARTDAIGLQKPIGVAFIYNPSTNVQTMAEVEFPNCPAWTTNLPLPALGCVSATYNGITYYYMNATGNTVILPQPPAPSAEGDVSPLKAVYGPPLELRVDTDLQALPAGIAVQTVCNASYSGGQRTSDGYLSVGVILFDGQGRLTSLPYGISGGSLLASSSGLNQNYPSATNVGIYNASNVLTQFGVPSQFGLVVFQRNAFVGQGFTANDPTYFFSTASASSAYTDSSAGPSQAQQETWLDENSTPLLINRYTGTLIRGE